MLKHVIYTIFMLPEIWSVTDIVFCHFGHLLPFYSANNLKNQNFEKVRKTPGDIIILLLCTTNVNVNHMKYGSWDMEHKSHIFFLFLTIFCPFTPPIPSSSPKTHKKKFWKNEKRPGHIIILGMCAINENHIMYNSWDMEHDRQNFFSIWTIFYPFTALPTQKFKILKKWNKCLEI